MATDKPTTEPHPQREEAARHIAEAHRILKKLRQEAAPAPREAIVEAIEKLEMALAILSVKTGGML